MVGRRSDWVEDLTGVRLDRLEMRILAVVGSKQSENLCHRKGKGSLTMEINQGSVNPNLIHNMNLGKGKQVNIPVLLK